MNRVTIRWTGPSWLKRFDPQRKMKLFWRANSVYIGNRKTTDQMLRSLTQLRYVTRVSVGGSTKFSKATIRKLKDEFEVSVENAAAY